MTDRDSQLLGSTSHESATAEGTEEKSTTEGNEEKLRELAGNYEAKMDAVADLITRVRHEINNPLTGVLGQAQLLLREDLPESARRRAEKIEELAIRIRDIVAELRQFQKNTNG